METIVKKWGNSLGVVLPKAIIEKEGIHEGSKIEIIIKNKKFTRVKDILGILKFKESTDKIMKEVDKDLWGEE